MSSAAPAPTAHSSGVLPARVILPLAICTLIWGSTWTAIRYQLGTVDHNWSIAYRFGIAALTMYVLARRYGAPVLVRRDELPLVTAVAVMQFLLNFVCIYAAESHITSGLVAMIFSLLIVPNAVFGWLFMGHRVGASFIFGTALAVAGMALLFHPQLGQVGGSGDGNIALGVALTLGAVFSASFGNLLQATRRAGQMHWATLLLWAMGLAALFNALLALVTTGAPQWDPRPSYWIATVYLGFLGTALSFPVYLLVIRLIGPARAAYSGIIIPIVAMGFSTVLEDYRWTPEAIAGSVLAVIGLYFAMRARKPA
jgi:drug/metabolite transporter (DMT)-like permease